MGLIKAGIAALSTTLADQWKEYFICESLSNDILLAKGQKKISGKSSNTKGSDNIITNGSGIVVADGQCMIIVDQGKVVEVCAEPGEFTYDTSSEPSIFSGKFGKSLVDTFKTIGKRFTYGGDTGKDQRVYYINTKEILDNKFGTQTPIMFRVVDNKCNLDIDVQIRCSGVYTFQITNPLLFYTKLAGNVTDSYGKDQIASTMKTEFVSALQPAFGKLSELEIRPSGIPAKVNELKDAVNEALATDWVEGRGISISKIALNPISLTEEDQKRITDAQAEARYTNLNLAGAGMAAAQMQAMKDAANNGNGAMNGFIGMGFAQQAGGMNANKLYEMGAAQAEAQVASQPQQATSQKAEGDWFCPKCGTKCTGNFCPECGEKKPQLNGQWKCPKCGNINNGKFCPNCGEKRD